MIFEISDEPLSKIPADGLVVFSETPAFTQADKALNGQLSETLEFEKFKGKPGEFLTVQTQKKIASRQVFILGLGEEKNAYQLRRSLSLFSQKVSKKISSLVLAINAEEAQVIAEGLLLGSYTFDKYVTKEKTEKKLEKIIFFEENKNTALKIKEGVRRAEVFCTAVKIARDLVNEPPAVVTPTFLADFAESLVKKDKNIHCKIYDKNELEKMGMGAFLGVAQASETPPKFIFLEYRPKTNSRKKLALVGKGITFDSGGISIKPGDSMQTMKLDMAGAAAVLAVFSVIAEIKPSFSVMGLVAATPNLISGKGLCPGDILKSLNGKTIEILNTDAEGRVTLADSLAFAVKNKATEIINFATLTGACEVALGTNIAGLFSNNKILKEQVKKAAQKAGEKVWELPLEEEYKELNKSEVADISNIPSTRYGGAITAALFLEEFVGKLPFVHLDIAGPAYAEKASDFSPKGGTGFAVRTLLELLSERDQ